MGFQTELAGLQSGLDIDEICSETSDGYCSGSASVLGRNVDVDLRIIGILVQVEAITGDSEAQLSCVYT